MIGSKCQRCTGARAERHNSLKSETKAESSEEKGAKQNWRLLPSKWESPKTTTFCRSGKSGSQQESVKMKKGEGLID